MYSRQYNYIFIHIPKCGGTNVESALKKYACPSTGEKWARTHKAWRNKLLFDLIEKYPDFYMFTFTRDPMDRCVSAYNHFAGQSRCSMNQFLDGIERFLNQSPEEVFRHVGGNKTVQKTISVPPEWKNCKLPQLIGYHILPQSYFIVNEKIKCFNISTINSKLLEIATDLGIPDINIKKTNPYIVSSNERVHSHEVEKCRDRVYSLYSADRAFT